MEALRAAASLTEYTLSDRGTWLSSPSDVTGALRIYKAGSEENRELLNPCHLLSSPSPMDEGITNTFMDWIRDWDGGQLVVRTFVKNGDILYGPGVTAA